MIVLNTFILNIKSTIIIISNKIKNALALTTTILATIIAIKSNEANYKFVSNLKLYSIFMDNINIIALIVIISFIIYIVVLFITTYIRVLSGKLSVKIFYNKTINILNGDEYKNFLYIINSFDFKQNFKDYIFIYPFPMNGKALKAWPNSSLNNIINYLDSNYNILLDKKFKPSTQIQKSVDDYLQNKKDYENKINYNIIKNIEVKYKKEILDFKKLYPLEFGDIIESNIEIYDNNNEKIILHLLLVANYIDSYDMLYTSTHNEIIISNCFNYIAKLQQYKNVAIYLVGVRDYDMNLLNVFDYIIHAFAKVCISNSNNSLKELTISCPEKDITKWNANFGQLESYALTISKYYNQKGK